MVRCGLTTALTYATLLTELVLGPWVVAVVACHIAAALTFSPLFD
jgi:hypothetical protein